MVNTKVVVLLIALSVVIAAIAGIAFTQYASAQANASRGVAGQLPQGGYNGYYQAPQQGYYPNGGAQYGNSYGYGYGMGMGMCGRFW
ncbi:MAG: hypothetical protein M1167_04175 [Chloroflexi bacterium]|nr:hypothetical protein [Chloroflexota bacterium]